MTDIVLITGGSRGIGLATARALGRAGARVIITGRSTDTVEPALKTLAAEGISVDGEILDVTSYDDARRVIGIVADRYGRLDVLVNNAGVAGEWSYPADENGFVDHRAVRMTFDTNVIGVCHMSDAALPLLRNSSDGRIVNVSSYMGSLTLQAQSTDPVIVPAYQASKAALNSLTLSLAASLADSGIRVVSIDPGFVQTDFSPINRDLAPLTAEQGAEPIVRAALGTLETGTFVARDGLVPW